MTSNVKSVDCADIGCTLSTHTKGLFDDELDVYSQLILHISSENDARAYGIGLPGKTFTVVQQEK